MQKKWNKKLKKKKLKKVIQRIKNHIKKVTLRHLSLYGKIIFINTLNQATYLSNVFPIPIPIITEMHNLQIQGKGKVK